VDRSAPLPPGATLTVADVAADCEEVRQELGIDRWAVLGQSSGGGLALRYAAGYPAAVTGAIFENPVWDMASSTRAALVPLAAMLADRGKDAEPQAARTAAAATPALSALGADREQFFIPNAATRERLADLRRAHEARERGSNEAGDESSKRHHVAFTADQAFVESMLGLLPRLTAPALLITGGRDPLTAPEQRAAFRDASPRNQHVEFAEAGHFVHAEDPDQYAQCVMKFVRSLTEGR